MIAVLQRAASLLLAAAFFLPLAQCSPVQGEAAGAAPQDIAAYAAYDWPSLGYALTLVVFFWPLLAQGAALLRPAAAGTRRRIRPYAALAMCLLSAAGVSWLTLLGTHVRYGAAVAFGAIVLYAGATALQLWRYSTMQHLHLFPLGTEY